MKGVLTLIPTPIDEYSPLEQTAFSLLQKICAANDEKFHIAVEEPKSARQRWLRFGLPREMIGRFVIFNEHTQEKLSSVLLKSLHRGENVYLMSDGGMPAFCDPGRMLVDLCHSNNIQVTSTPFPNSVSLAVALSGFNHDRFVFQGFLPRNKDERSKRLQEINHDFRTQIIMDTPYRLGKLLTELKNQSSLKSRRIFVACDLGFPEERLVRGSLSDVFDQLSSCRCEFVLVIDQVNHERPCN